MAKKAPLKVITISSGKGGVGKTNVSANLAVSLAKTGKRVILLDADLGLGNLDVILGLSPKYNFAHVVRGEMDLEDIVVEGPMGIKIIPAASGIQELTNLTAAQKVNLFTQVEALHGGIDMLLIDTGAGISNNVLFFNLVAGDKIIVACPEPTSIVDAYALMKVLHLKYGEKRFNLLVNMAENGGEGLEVYKNLTAVADKYLNISLDYLGYVPRDKKIPLSVRAQKPVSVLYPESEAAKSFMKLARVVNNFPPSDFNDNLHIFPTEEETEGLIGEQKPH